MQQKCKMLASNLAIERTCQCLLLQQDLLVFEPETCQSNSLGRKLEEWERNIEQGKGRGDPGHSANDLQRQSHFVTNEWEEPRTKQHPAEPSPSCWSIGHKTLNLEQQWSIITCDYQRSLELGGVWVRIAYGRLLTELVSVPCPSLHPTWVYGSFGEEFGLT